MVPHWWNGNIPRYSIFIDDKCLKTDTFKVNHELYRVEMPVTLDFGPHQLKIRFENKTKSDVLFDEHGMLMRENFFTLVKVIVDTVNFQDLHKTEGYFKRDFPDDRGNYIYKNNGKFSHQGEYILDFYSPIHYWILSRFDSTYTTP
jgi:hypothetical protein